MEPQTSTRIEYERKLLAEAAKLIGIKFLQNGRTPSQGLDCLGLIVVLQRTAGVLDFPDADRNFPSDWYVHETRELYLDALRTYGKAVDRTTFQIGDVLLFRLGLIFPRTGSMRIQHAGVLINVPDQQFVHCMPGRGVLTSSLKERAWSKCFTAAGRPMAVMRYLGEQ